jgi:hypothetical protein
MSEMTFYIPTTRWQLLEWLRQRYPADKKLGGMRKAQLLAIYFRIRSKE